ncbi:MULTISPECIES: pyridoxal phosphate-dependent aminotransferase [unclassified Aureimonas]|uniref:pyridoxal phosphate-dependent aminotransferase n=1 Tax=unclassified Aureimonas TaxID=2615206 RepID=UPI0007003D87|nr:MULTISPECIES: pyridoxal phosphate-dependent aminotransferase [unclassified Aureimonas]KQT60660.1 aspartate aminotransferase [Aureimonas sp. Leaf460]KQT68789.1 aspartate aminotransferase [Aureimonas sp. Leaf427]
MTHLDRLRREALAAPESGIVAIMNYARGREGLIPLWTGEGDLPTPAFISDAATKGLAAGETFYTWQRGIPELRQAIARYAGRLYGIPEVPERFFVTQSGMQAIQIAITAIAGPGDEIAFIGPVWPNFEAALALAGGVPREVSLDWGEDGWQLDIDKLKAAIGPKTKALFVNTPSNPTGWTADHDMLRAILGLAREAGLVVIADEIYSRFHYEGGRAPSFHDVMEPDEAILFVNSFSKNWAMTGWRIGWIEAPAELGDVIENLIQYSSSGVAAFMQRGAIAALDEGEPFVTSQIERAHVARDIWTETLKATNRVRIAAPKGAFYSFFAIDGLEDTRAAAFRIVDDTGVGLAPGIAFGPAGSPFLRACFHRRIDEIETAAERLASWIGRL